jgi:hypothetical protein
MRRRRPGIKKVGYYPIDFEGPRVRNYRNGEMEVIRCISTPEKWDESQSHIDQYFEEKDQ